MKMHFYVRDRAVQSGVLQGVEVFFFIFFQTFDDPEQIATARAAFFENSVDLRRQFLFRQREYSLRHVAHVADV